MQLRFWQIYKEGQEIPLNMKADIKKNSNFEKFDSKRAKSTKIFMEKNV